MNVSDDDETETVPDDTVSTTGIVTGNTPAVVLDTLILPMYVPIGRFAGFTMTFRLAGVEPMFGVTDSHVKPAGMVAAVAVKFNAVTLSVLVSDIVCSIGVEDPAMADTLITAGLAFSRGVLLTFTVTVIVCGALLDPGTDKVTVPVHVSGVVRPAVFTPMTISVGCPETIEVVPDAGLAVRKPLQLEVDVKTVKPIGAPALLRVIV